MLKVYLVLIILFLISVLFGLFLHDLKINIIEGLDNKSALFSFLNDTNSQTNKIDVIITPAPTPPPRTPSRAIPNISAVLNDLGDANTSAIQVNIPSNVTPTPEPIQRDTPSANNLYAVLNSDNPLNVEVVDTTTPASIPTTTEAPSANDLSSVLNSDNSLNVEIVDTSTPAPIPMTTEAPSKNDLSYLLNSDDPLDANGSMDNSYASYVTTISNNSLTTSPFNNSSSETNLPLNANYSSDLTPSPMLSSGMPQSNYSTLSPMMSAGMPQSNYSTLSPMMSAGMPQSNYSTLSPMMSAVMPQSNYSTSSPMMSATTISRNTTTPSPMMSSGMPQSNYTTLPMMREGLETSNTTTPSPILSATTISPNTTTPSFIYVTTSSPFSTASPININMNFTPANFNPVTGLTPYSQILSNSNGITLSNGRVVTFSAKSTLPPRIDYSSFSTTPNPDLSTFSQTREGFSEFKDDIPFVTTVAPFATTVAPFITTTRTPITTYPSNNSLTNDKNLRYVDVLGDNKKKILENINETNDEFNKILDMIYSNSYKNVVEGINLYLNDLQKMDNKTQTKKDVTDGSLNPVFLDLIDQIESEYKPFLDFYDKSVNSLDEITKHCLDYISQESGITKELLTSDMYHFQLLVYNLNSVLSGMLAKDGLTDLMNKLSENYFEINKLREKQINELSEFYSNSHNQLGDIQFSNLQYPVVKEDAINNYKTILDQLSKVSLTSSNAKLLSIEQKHIAEMSNLIDKQIEDFSQNIK